jgi:hypothetical protein
MWLGDREPVPFGVSAGMLGQIFELRDRTRRIKGVKLEDKLASLSDFI